MKISKRGNFFEIVTGIVIALVILAIVLFYIRDANAHIRPTITPKCGSLAAADGVCRAACFDNEQNLGCKRSDEDEYFGCPPKDIKEQQGLICCCVPMPK